MNVVTRALKDISLCRGRNTEDRFFEAMRTSASADMPRWFLRAKRPSFKEDRWEGKDAIIETTDVGKLFLQIKSSEAGAAHFVKGRHYRRNKFIGIIVIRERDSFEDILIKARSVLSQLRQDVLKNRKSIEW
ncbi:MAG: hypothetical protein A2481_01890 [Candidatus Yonathbacteria bacterium RIFOXYC2_FULL_47_9]|nr:MAG: hypothetical protein A2481_01890 [Candidatus Yonathbacteria bacterium RIFOXYC2_FULL_47_9]HAT68307.1 hypothetical protein [Candidatus Yonathbacteria bacterium]